MKFRRSLHYIGVYLFGSVVAVLNGLFFHSDLIFHATLLLLYGILLYKSIHILLHYQKTSHKYPAMDRQAFRKTYGLFRVRVALFWLAFIVLCVIGKVLAHLDKVYFYGCTFFFLFLDRWFVNKVCLLQKFSDFKGTTVRCCCGCPCRGWDLMMIHTPLLFALCPQGGLENAMIICASLLAVLSLIQWERNKYHLVETRQKCEKSCDLKLCREYQEVKK